MVHIVDASGAWCHINMSRVFSHAGLILVIPMTIKLDDLKLH